MNPTRLTLAALAAARLTRFVTSDSLGEWLAVAPAKRWAWRQERPLNLSGGAIYEDPNRADATGAAKTPLAHWGWRSKLVSGLDCPFCVGFWIGALVLLGEVVTRRSPLLRGVWTFALGALGLNYAVGHISSRIDG